MAQDNAEVFKKISHADDRTRIADELASLHAPLVCKAADHEELFTLEVMRVAENFRLICANRGAALPVPLPVSVVVSFSIGNDKYFLTTTLNEKWGGGGHFEIDFSVDLFHLQRRQAYRIRVPESYVSRFDISALNGAAVKLTSQVQDLSSAGLRIVCDPGKIQLKTGDVLEGQLIMGKKDPIPLRARIQHQKLTPLKTQELGVALTDLTPSLESRLFAITMELHRDLLAKLGH